MSEHSFNLRSASDLLSKTLRELERFKSSISTNSRDIEGQSDHAFNFVISAWHLTDWVWREYSSKTGEAFGCRSFNEFHSKVRRECEALQICYELATGSKHFHLKEIKDKSVKSTATKTTHGGGIVRSVVQPVVRPIVTSITGEYTVYGLVIRLSSGKAVKPAIIFEQTMKYWKGLLSEDET